MNPLTSVRHAVAAAALGGLGIGGLVVAFGGSAGLGLALAAISGLAGVTAAESVRSRREVLALRTKVTREQAALARLAERVEAVGQQVVPLARRTDVATSAQQTTRALFSQVEALLNLHAIAPPRQVMPASRGWAASPDVLLLLIGLLRTERPRTVVDLGSGTSSIWMAHMVRQLDLPTRIIAIDHDQEYADQTRRQAEALELTDVLQVRHAPLVAVDLGGEQWPWYDIAGLADVDQCDLLFVDGPPGSVRPMSRYPALPMLVTRLSPRAKVVMDDFIRDDEQKIVRRWLDEYDGWRMTRLPLEKGTAVLERIPAYDRASA